jgi:hypothetical protein
MHLLQSVLGVAPCQKVNDIKCFEGPAASFKVKAVNSYILCLYKMVQNLKDFATDWIATKTSDIM